MTDVSEELTAFVISMMTITLIMEAVSSSKPSFDIYQATWCNIPEDSHLQGTAGVCNVCDATLTI
jgi:hypothetical protein